MCCCLQADIVVIVIVVVEMKNVFVQCLLGTELIVAEVVIVGVFV